MAVGAGTGPLGRGMVCHHVSDLTDHWSGRQQNLCRYCMRLGSVGVWAWTCQKSPGESVRPSLLPVAVGAGEDDTEAPVLGLSV